VRAFVPGCDDTAEFRFQAGRWMAENGEMVQIRFNVSEAASNSLLQDTADLRAAESVASLDLDTQLHGLPARSASIALVH
jgi:hypothetical protein